MTQESEVIDLPHDVNGAWSLMNVVYYHTKLERLEVYGDGEAGAPRL